MGFSFPEFLSNVSTLDIMDRVKNSAMGVFNTAAGYLKTYDNYSEEENLKAFALISCISLVALLLINILFKNGRSIVSSLPVSTSNESR